jgi:hypothetical protein
MTNKQRLKGFVGFAASEETLDGVLIDHQINPSLAYDGTNVLLLKRAAIDVLKVLLSSPDITNDTGFTHKYDRNAVAKRISQLEDELDPVVKEKATVTAKQYW